MWQILLTPIFLLALYVGVNLFSPSLDKDFDTYFYKEQVAPVHNAGFLIQGLNAPEGYDPHAFAALVMETRPYTDDPIYDPKSREELTPVFFKDFDDENLVLDCWTAQDFTIPEERVCASEEEIKLALAENKFLMQRYELLWPYKRFYHDTLYGYTKGQDFISMNDLRNASLALMAKNGDVESALDIWIKRQAFFNMVMADGQSLVFKAIMMIMYSRNLFVLPVVLSHADQDTFTAYKDRLDAVLDIPAFGDDGFDIRATTSSEYFTVFEAEEIKESFAKIGGEYNPLGKIFYSENATANAYLKFAKDLIAAAEKPPTEMREEMQKIQEDFMPSYDYTDMIYNPIGKLLLGGMVKGAELFDNRNVQVARMHMLRLYIHAKADGITPETIPEYIAQNAALATNTYTNQPYNWDSETHTLYFERTDYDYTTRYSVVY